MFYSQLIFKKEKLGYWQEFSLSLGVLPWSKSCTGWCGVVPWDGITCLAAWDSIAWEQTGWQWVSCPPPRERGMLPPVLDRVAIGALLSKLPLSALGQGEGVSYGAGKMLLVLLVVAPALFIIVIARWKNHLIWRRSKNVLPSLMPTLPLQEFVCKLCRNPENHFIMVLICSVQLLSHWLSKPGMSGCHTSAMGDYWKVSADAVQSTWGGALHCLTRSCWVVLFPPFSL